MLATPSALMGWQLRQPSHGVMKKVLRLKAETLQMIISVIQKT